MAKKQNNNLSLLNAIENDIITFSFTKVNGDIRIASGTRNMELIPERFHPKGTGRDTPPDILKFFDWSKNQWRSCRQTKIFGHWFIANKDLLYRLNRYDELGLDDPYDYGNTIKDLELNTKGKVIESTLIK